ncbi:MAG TPA: putative quinol monooxygenase [Bryobacteraceae bacterium]|nr:putative quinol monooxygenase [Bryobacteraceae bacterium]
MSLYIFARFEPKAGKLQLLHDELLKMVTPARDEPGCISVHLFEAAKGPPAFFVHSEWADEASFEAHCQQPHVVRFGEIAAELMANPFRAARTKEIF